MPRPPQGGAGNPLAGLLGNPDAAGAFAKLAPHLPRILSFAMKVPAYLLGFIFAFIYFVFIVGGAALRQSYYPSVLLDLVGLALAAVVIEHGLAAWATYQHGKWQQQQTDQLTRDIRVKQHKDELD